jgi:hypothetical protein
VNRQSEQAADFENKYRKTSPLGVTAELQNEDGLGPLTSETHPELHDIFSLSLISCHSLAPEFLVLTRSIKEILLSFRSCAGQESVLLLDTMVN